MSVLCPVPPSATLSPLARTSSLTLADRASLEQALQVRETLCERAEAAGTDESIPLDELRQAWDAVPPFDDFDAVLETCNASRFGLQAGLFTSDIGRVLTAWRELEVGGLVVNGSSNFRLDHVPFGGVKDSGFGRESPRFMVEDYTVATDDPHLADEIHGPAGDLRQRGVVLFEEAEHDDGH